VGIEIENIHIKTMEAWEDEGNENTGFL